jgi:hypothetical protein
MKNFCSNIYFQAFPPATIIFAGISVLISVRVPASLPCATYIDTEGLQAAKEASASPDNLIDIFNRIERFFCRVEVYAGIIPTTAMTDMIVEIMVEVLTILAVATKEVKCGRFSELVLRLFTLPFSTDGLFREVL